MASSSVSQESLDHEDFEYNTRRCRIRALRSRSSSHKNDSLDSIDRDGRDQNGEAAGELDGGPVVPPGVDHESPTRTSTRSKEKRGRPNHLHKGKTAKDKRKLREKRRSTGVVHLPSTEAVELDTRVVTERSWSCPSSSLHVSTGDSLDDDDDDKTSETKRNTSYNEVIDADNPQTPNEGRPIGKSANNTNSTYGRHNIPDSTHGRHNIPDSTHGRHNIPDSTYGRHNIPAPQPAQVSRLAAPPTNSSAPWRRSQISSKVGALSKGFNRSARNKSPSDLEADLEDNQDYDSTVSQSETNLTIIGQSSPQPSNNSKLVRSCASPDAGRLAGGPASGDDRHDSRPVSYPSRFTQDADFDWEHKYGHPIEVVRRHPHHHIRHHDTDSNDVSHVRPGFRERTHHEERRRTGQDSLETKLIARNKELEKLLDQEREEKKYLQDLLEKRDSRIAQLEKEITLLQKQAH